MLRSSQCLIKCSRRCYVLHILRWDVDPTTGISPWILSGITPFQFHLLYKASKGIIFPHFTSLRALQKSQTLKPPRFLEFPNLSSPFLKKYLNLLKVQGSTHVFILVSFYCFRFFSPRPISSAFYSLFPFFENFFRIPLAYLDGYI